MRNNIYISTMIASAIPALCSPLLWAVEHTVDYSAEHLIESNMNERYLAFPDIEIPGSLIHARMQIGYADIHTGPLQSKTILLGGQWSQAWADPSWTWIYGGFADYLQFSGDAGPATLHPIFTDAAPFARTLPIVIHQVRGDAIHAGVSLAVSQRPSNIWAWQLGLAFEYYDVRQLAVTFGTTNLNQNFDGVIDYAAHYNSLTPHYGATWFLPSDWAKSIWSGTLFSARFIAAYPGPRRGFYGQVSGPDFSYEGKSSAKHIPDFYSGAGFTIESARSHWRIDLGATLYFLTTESHIKNGTEPRLYLSWSIPMQ